MFERPLRLSDNRNDLAGSRVNQHGTLVHDGVAIGVSKSHAWRNRRKSSLRRERLPYSYWLSKPDRGAPLTGHVGTHASGLLSAQDSTKRRTCDAADCRADRTTHDSADNSPTGNPGRKA